MITINATKKLNNTNMKEFLNNIVDESFIAVSTTFEENEVLINVTKDTLKTIFFNHQLQQAIKDKSQLITILDVNVAITFSGADYNWYKNNETRVEDLFNENFEEKPKKQKKVVEPVIEKTCTIAGAIEDEETGLRAISQLVGNKKTIIEFMNNYYAEHTLRSNFKAKIVFNIGFSNEQELLDESNWFTLEQLAQANILELEQ